MVLRADPTLFELRSRSSTAAEGSPVPIRERIEAASAAGFTGLGLLHADLMPALDRYGISGLRTLLDDHGIVDLELEAPGNATAG